jgi:hypothetical protein
VGTVNLEGFYTVGAAFLVLFGEKACPERSRRVGLLAEGQFELLTSYTGVIPNARVLTSGRRDLAWTILAEETGLMR